MILSFFFHPYATALFLSTIVSLLLCARAWLGTKKELSRAFALFQAAIFLWGLFRFLLWELFSPLAQLQALKLQYLGIVFVPGTFYLIARAIAKRPFKRFDLALVFVPALVSLALLATDALHHYFWVDESLSGLPVSPRGSWGFWLFNTYAFGLVVAAFFILAKASLRARGLASRWMRRVFFLFFLPFAVNFVFLVFFADKSAADPTPIVFAVSGLFLTLVMRHFDILERVPYAKSLILESIDSPLIVVDPEGLIVGANEIATTIVGGRKGLEGRAIVELVPSLGGTIGDRDTREWTLGGIDYLITCYVVKKSSALWQGRLFLFRDVSALMKAQREAEEARARADAANEAKSAWIAVVSHELRNPLNAIIGLADLNLRASLPAELREDLEVILSSGNVLLGLVNDLLDLSKIEAGKMELESVDFDLHEKAVSMLKAFRPIVEKKGIFLDITIKDGTPRRVRGDPLRYGQILMNLVSNAVKFTERGAVTVDIEPAAAPLDEDPRSLRVLTSVRDTGMGIASERLPLLFRDFSQGDPSVGRRFGGTGLGLSISKKLTGLFGGEIEVKSSPGQGSVFSFSVRFRPGEDARVAAVPESRGADERRLRVLLVDDEPINSAVARRYLGRMGHEAMHAGSGAEALALARGGEFDLILLDLGLPDMDGFEACRRLRSEAGWAGNVLIAAMTARTEPGLRAACASAGMIECLTKPLDPSALERLMAEIAGKARELAPHAAASVTSPLPKAMVRPVPADGDDSRTASLEPAGPGPARPDAPLIDAAAFLESIDGDEPFMRELLGIFVSEARGRDTTFATALAARDLGALRRQAHALRGS
jgi:signal transduction histidine kinase/DNA-binding NarL/FixJ family response regulator